MDFLARISDIVGQKNILTGRDAEPYGTDWMKTHVGTPRAVVRPANTKELSQLLRAASDSGTPVVPVGGNTGLVGGTHAPGKIMVSLERLNRIREIRAQSRIAIVEAGTILSNIHAAAEAEALYFPLFFGARGSATIGGALSTNAGGSNVLRYGNTRALCLGLEVVLADGRVMNLMSELHKDNSGYDLKDLFIGAEGTLGIITAAVMKLVPLPRAHATAMIAARSLPAALDLLNVLQDVTGGLVEAFEYMPRSYLERLRLVRPDLTPPLGHDRDTTILVELGATAPRDSAVADDGSVPLVGLLEDALAQAIGDGLANDAVVARSQKDRLGMWAMREAAAEITFGRTPHVDFDVALPLEKVALFLARAQDCLNEIDPKADTNCVAHLGDGNVHFTVWPSRDDADLITRIHAEIDAVSVALGGSFSAEHGTGLSKLGTMRRGKDPVALDVMRALKKTLDPENILNPGKVLPDG